MAVRYPISQRKHVLAHEYGGAAVKPRRAREETAALTFPAQGPNGRRSTTIRVPAKYRAANRGISRFHDRKPLQAGYKDIRAIQGASRLRVRESRRLLRPAFVSFKEAPTADGGRVGPTGAVCPDDVKGRVWKITTLWQVKFNSLGSRKRAV